MKTFLQYCCTITLTGDSGDESGTPDGRRSKADPATDTTTATTTLTGDSGRKYEFEVYALDAELDAVGAVYAVTRRDGDRHVPLYFGQTGDISVRLSGHHKSECFDENDADCLCVHRDDELDSRLKKELDLMIRHHPACNGPQ
jgi:hypothetical protein